MQSFEHRSVRYWSKEINGTLTGGRKKYFFFNSRTPPWRARRWNPVNSWTLISLSSLRSLWTRAIAYAAYAAAASVRIRSFALCHIGHDLPNFSIDWRAPSAGACGVGDYPTPDLGGVREPICIHKK